MWFVPVLLSVLALAAGTPRQAAPCCPKQMVGDDVYIYKDMSEETVDYGCVDACVYTLYGTDRRFCFAPGLPAAKCVEGPEFKDQLFTLSGNTKNTTLVNLESGDICENLPVYPGGKEPAFATYFKGSVLACGGINYEDSNKCYTFDGSKWSEQFESLERHCWADTNTLVVPEGLWIIGRAQTGTGGCNSGSNYAGEIWTGEEFISGPTQPPGVDAIWACVAELDASQSMFIGGQPNSSDVYIYNWDSDTWAQSTSLLQGKNRQGCISLGDKGVLAIGGDYYGNDHTVELFDPFNETWSYQPRIPNDVNPYYPTILKHNTGHVIALFTGSDQVYYRAKDGDWSAIEDVTLNEPGTGRTLVPGNFVPACIPRNDQLFTLNADTKNSTIVNLKSGDICENLPAYPGGKEPAFVTYFKGSVLACGGLDYEDSNKCYTFDGYQWSEQFESLERHCFADTHTLVVPEGLWIVGRAQTGTGGCSPASSSPATAGEIWTGEEFIPGPTQPSDVNVIWACVAELDASQSMFIGGLTPAGRSSPDAYIYNWDSDTWTQTTSLLQGKNRQGCISLGDKGVLAIGGDFNDRTVELFDPFNETWSNQQSLPSNVDPNYPTILKHNTGHVIGLFTGSDQVYYRAKDGDWSAIEDVTIEPGTGRTLVPGNFGPQGCGV